MGRRGPPPKPTHIRLLDGNPGKRPLNRREPRPRSDTPRCPAWLLGEAKKVWKRMVNVLRGMGVLTVADGEALAAFCQVYVRWRQAEEFLDKHGVAYPLRDDRGQIKCMVQFPQVTIARHQLQVLCRLYQEFGLTPASRSRIELPPWVPEPVPGELPITDRLGRPC